jgi:hypothetical protein
MWDHADALADAIIALTVALIGAVVWFVRLEGRVNLLDRVLVDHLDAKTRSQNDVVARLTRLEEKIDRINLRCASHHGDTGYVHHRASDVEDGQ